MRSLYSSPNIIRMNRSRRMSWAGHAAQTGANRREYGVFVGNPEGKTPLGMGLI
jgi:hypothetical protein